LVFPLGQRARPHRRQCQELAGRQGHPATAPPPYSPDLAPADFLFRKVKEELAGLHLTQESLKSAWEGVTRTIGEDEFATAFRRWYERSEKGRICREKLRNKHLAISYCCRFIKRVSFVFDLTSYSMVPYLLTHTAGHTGTVQVLFINKFKINALLYQVPVLVTTVGTQTVFTGTVAHTRMRTLTLHKISFKISGHFFELDKINIVGKIGEIEYLRNLYYQT
jgi:transposase